MRTRIPWGGRYLACAMAFALLPVPAVWANTPPLKIGLVFVDVEPVPLDFLNATGTPVHLMNPWPITDPTRRFVQEGALAGMTEPQVQREILKGVRDRYFSVPAGDGLELKVDLILGRVEGAGSINVILGAYNLESGTDHWFGQSDFREAFDRPQGGNMAAVAIDELATLGVTFDQPQKAINAIANVTAHEIGHLYGLRHVCAGPNCTDCVGGCAIVTNPYDIMATGPSGLPESGWIADNEFTSTPGTQTSGLSTIDTLLANMGTRLIGDTDYDDDVDTSDLLTLLEGWTGSIDYGLGGAAWSVGDMDHDEDVDSSDLLALLGGWTGSSAAARSGTAAVPEPSGVGLFAMGLVSAWGWARRGRMRLRAAGCLAS